MIHPPHATAEEIPQREAVEEYLELEAKGKKNSKSYDDLRGKYGLRRNVDGRIQVRGQKGDWWSVRLDMEVAQLYLFYFVLQI
jgi:hypothetical protein